MATKNSATPTKAARAHGKQRAKPAASPARVGEGHMLAAIRVRGVAGVRWRTKEILVHLKLTRRNHLVLLKDTPSAHSLLRECKDYIGFGEVSPEVIAKLEQRQGKRKVYRLNSPKKGFGSIKWAYPHGALGNHGEKINSLIERML